MEDPVAKVLELDRKHFAVKLHLKSVKQFSNPKRYSTLIYADTLDIQQEVVPLMLHYQDAPKALPFDALMHGIEPAYLAGKKYDRAKSDLISKVAAISKLAATIPAFGQQTELIQQILHTKFLEQAGINEFEHIHEKLRDLIQYIPSDGSVYDTNLQMICCLLCDTNTNWITTT